MSSPAEILLLPREQALDRLHRFDEEQDLSALPCLAGDDCSAWGLVLAAFLPDEYDPPADLPAKPVKQEPGVSKVSLLRERQAARTSLYHPEDPAWLPPELGRDCWHIRNGSTAVGEVEVYDWEFKEDEEAAAEAYDARPYTLRYPDGRELVIDLRPYRTLNRKGGDGAA